MAPNISTERASTQQDMLEMTRGYFQGVMGTAESDASRRGLNFQNLGLEQLNLAELEEDFGEEEIWKTIRDMPAEKAPGPDGFTGLFYQACWDTIKCDVLAALHKFFSGNSQNLERLNSAVIILLPKKEAPALLKDYQPISLIHSFSNLATKLMATRLAGRMGDLIPYTQSAFIRGRSIHENFMFVRGMARRFHTEHQPMVLLKLDISRAFDSVSWPFLLQLLQHRGFGMRW